MTEELTNKKSSEKPSSQGPIFGYVYFEDPIITLPQPFKALINLVSRTIWGLLWIIMLFFVGEGIYYLTSSQQNFFQALLSRSPYLSLFWLGILLALYLIYHHVKTKRPFRRLSNLDKKNLTTAEINIAEYLEPASKTILAHAFSLSKNKGFPFELALFSVLLRTKQSQDFMHHLELSENEIAKELRNRMINFRRDYELSQQSPRQSLEKIAKIAFLRAYEVGSSSIKPHHFLMALFESPHPVLADIFLKHKVDPEDAVRVALLLRIKHNLIIKISRRPRKIKHKTMNRSWTAKPTYVLDSFSDDLTDLARHGLISSLVGHKEEYRAMVDIMNQDARNNVLLLGESGSGRQAIINELARKIIRDEVPPRLFDRRLVSLKPGAILAGIKAPGALQERMQKIMNEITASKNIILAIPQIHDLIRAVENQALSFMSFFGPAFSSIDFPLVATTDTKNYHSFIEKRGDLAGSFNIVKVKELSKDEALQFLMREALVLEKKEGIAISYYALKESVELSERYLKNRLLPSKAYDLLTQAIEEAKLKKKSFVSKEEIRASLSRATGIPISQAKGQESKKLLNLEAELHKRLIDQEPAVKAVSEMLRQARAGLERKNGPIGVFLFVGPTGVGKTELAKTLSSIYFGGEDRMLRFDMSEYQNADSIYRLIGSKEKGGLLTERIKNQPFSLLLLDEFEKAHSDVLNLFLQVFDDGRLTDELGNVVDFTNTIIIATSNAHSLLIQKELKEGKPIEEIKKIVKEKLSDIYRPELLNRFDDIIVFKTLAPEEVKQIALLKLKALFDGIEEEKGFKLDITETALNKIVELGYEPQNGARPIRRAITKNIKNLIANAILGQKLEKGQKYLIDFENNKFVIKFK